MTPIRYETLITLDGEYVFPVNQLDGIIELEGTLGAATATIGYADSDGNFVAFRAENGDPVETNYPGAWMVLRVRSGKYAVKVIDADGTTSFKLLFTPF